MAQIIAKFIFELPSGEGLFIEKTSSNKYLAKKIVDFNRDGWDQEADGTYWPDENPDYNTLNKSVEKTVEKYKTEIQSTLSEQVYNNLYYPNDF